MSEILQVEPAFRQMCSSSLHSLHTLPPGHAIMYGRESLATPASLYCPHETALCRLCISSVL